MATVIKRDKKFLSIVALGLFCVGCGFFGGWAAQRSSLTVQPTTITEKRQMVSDEADVVADVAERVSPSVVSIVIQAETVFGLQTITQEGAGTGIVITKNGYVLTNRHVVSSASDISIVMSDGKTYDDVEIVGVDPANDIAFLKIKNVQNLTPASLGDSSQSQVGEKVIAIGNALGQYQTSVTSGIISGKGRPVVAGGQGGDSEQLSNLLQTDAAINPGNSGGPLVNLDGEVIGMNTAIDQEAQGIGFAIPINDIKGLVKNLEKTGKVSRAYLGVAYVAVNNNVADQYKLSVREGAYIINENGPAVVADSPASRAGLKSGDVITRIGTILVSKNNPLQSVISQYAPGDTVKITYIRDSKSKTVEATLATFPQQ